jgi:hypothetical protein
MDHVRGSSLAWPASLETLRPFILTWWSGRTVADMPADIRAAHDAANFRQAHLNLALVVLDEKAKVLRGTVPRVRPPAFQFDPEAQGRDFKAQLDDLLAGLKLPRVERPAKPKLTLPDVCGEGQPAGVRILLTFAANHLNHYRTPTVEAVPMTDDLRKALRYPGKASTIAATDVRPWLEQMYPPAIMDGKGGFRKIESKLRFVPAGEDATYRYATIEGDVEFLLDNEARSGYQGSLAIVVKYRREGLKLYSVRGLCECDVPKGPEKIRMTAVIESRPE